MAHGETRIPVENGTPPEADPTSAHDTWAHHRRTADRVFQGATLLTVILTVAWLFFLVTGRDGGAAFRSSRVTLEGLVTLALYFSIMFVAWGYLWYHIKRVVLRRLAGLSAAEIQATFTSRMREPFLLGDFVSRHSERRIRIADMIGRRGRFMTIGLLGFWFAYAHIASTSKPEFLVAGMEGNLFDGVVMSWITLALYYSDGFLARVSLGAQSRIMDGTLGRANCLLIMTLWTIFRFVMVPIAERLGRLFPPDTYAVVFAFIWLSYLTSDALSEIVGSLFGKQKLRVWGLGEVNRKSLEGTAACFLGSLVLCLCLVWVHGLPLPWVGLAVVISVSNTVFELFSPRGTDDFTMATANALLCWAFGAFVL